MITFSRECYLSTIPIDQLLKFCSIWTVDLAYLLQKFCVEFSYYTITFGANPNYSIEEFYKVSKL